MCVHVRVDASGKRLRGPVYRAASRIFSPWVPPERGGADNGSFVRRGEVGGECGEGCSRRLWNVPKRSPEEVGPG